MVLCKEVGLFQSYHLIFVIRLILMALDIGNASFVCQGTGYPTGLNYKLVYNRSVTYIIILELIYSVESSSIPPEWGKPSLILVLSVYY